MVPCLGQKSNILEAEITAVGSFCGWVKISCRLFEFGISRQKALFISLLTDIRVQEHI